jgi:hypothetical protein
MTRPNAQGFNAYEQWPLLAETSNGHLVCIT